LLRKCQVFVSVIL